MKKLLTIILVVCCCSSVFAAKKKQAPVMSDREYWAAQAYRIAAPVLEPM